MCLIHTQIRGVNIFENVTKEKCWSLVVLHKFGDIGDRRRWDIGIMPLHIVIKGEYDVHGHIEAAEYGKVVIGLPHWLMFIA